MKRTSFLLAMLLAVGIAPADEAGRLSADMLWNIDRLASPVVSPDGRQMVVAVTEYEGEGDESETRLWLLATDGKSEPRPLTVAGAKASDAVFARDGSRLAFVSKRSDDEVGQIYVLPMDGPGEAVRLGDIPTGASALEWVGGHIYFVSSIWPGKSFEEMREQLKADEEKMVSAMVWNRMPYAHFDTWLDENRQNHLFRIRVTDGEIESLTAATGLELPRAGADANDFDISPDGRTIAFVANSSSEGIYPDNDVFLLETGTDRARNITEANTAPDGSPQFSPDGRRLAFLQQRIPGFYGDQARLMLHDMESGETKAAHADWDRSAGGLVWAPDSRSMYGAIDDAGTRRIFALPLDGRKPAPVTAATDFDQLSMSDNGVLIARNQSFVYPPRAVRIDRRSGSVRRLESFNDDLLKDVELGSYESVTYTGAGDKDIQMWVHYPPGFNSGKKYPLFLLIHGGPHGAMTNGFHFRWNAQTFSSWGYVTAWPNFHGSSGFGQDFTDSINPDWATKPYADIISAASWFMDKPWIDNDRLVAGGGSYGGYLSTIILGREHPFNALVIHAAVYDLYAQMSADFAVHDQRFGPYWESPDIYRAISPHYFAGKFATPSLVIHGQRDLRVPVGQAFELFRTLQTRGVESRLVYYPDENHWVLKRSNSLHWYNEVKEWIERYAPPGPAGDVH